MIRPLFVSIFAGLLVFSCAAHLHSKKVIRNDIEMLYGPVTLEQLYFDYPQWQENEKAYQPNADITVKLAKIEGTFEVSIFLATWCSDSRREVPRFIKIIKSAQLDSKIKINMWAVDRKLSLPNGFEKEYNIKKVATFIFYRNGKEIGRIIETPDSLLLEEDVLTILNNI